MRTYTIEIIEAACIKLTLNSVACLHLVLEISLEFVFQSMKLTDRLV